MKKILIRSAGGRDKLEFSEAPDLVPHADEVVIDVKAIGINFADVCVRLGVYESAKEYVGWPITPGFEVSGKVMKTGPDVRKYQVGQEVVGFTRFNAYASQVCISENQVMPVPKGFSLTEAAGFPAVFFTAYHALFQHVILPKNAKVLIHSAAGGVGTALVQLSKASGYFTVGVIGSGHKRKYLETFSPDVIVDKSQPGFWGEIKRACPDGFDAVFDANGFTTLKQSYEHLRPTGKLIVYGSHDLLSKKSGTLNYLKAGFGLLKTPRFWPLDMMTRNRGVIGFNVSFLFDERERIQECISGFQSMNANGKIKPIPVTCFPFEKVADAHAKIESGTSVGKIVLTL